MWLDFFRDGRVYEMDGTKAVRVFAPQGEVKKLAESLRSTSSGMFKIAEAGKTPPVLSKISIKFTGRPFISFDTPYSNSELRSHLDEIERRGYEPLIFEAAMDFNLQPSIIAGVGSRESFWGLILTPKGPTGVGDGGHGHGLMQIDDGSHEFAKTGNWQDPRENIRYGCDLLFKNMKVLKKEGLTGKQLLKATLASYNAGLGAILKALDRGDDVDSVTAGKDYGKNCIDRAGWFQKFTKWE